jgi:patatin-like phospholipase/acyl hydrolase
MKILSITGGGVWGAGVSNFLNKLGKKTAEPKDYFDVFAGTSTGSIIAACLAFGMSGEEIEKIYDENIKRIFTTYPWWKRKIPFTSYPTYQNKYFKQILKKVFGDTRMCDLGNLYIVSWRTTGKNRTKVFGPSDTTFVRDAVLASSSAPTYFSPYKIDNDYYLDGGLVFNNPSLVAVADVSRNVDLKDISLLTIVTGGDHKGEIIEDFTLIGAGKYLAKNLLTGRVTGTDYICDKFLDNTFTVCPMLIENQNYDLDDVDKVKEIKDIWTKEYNKVDKDLRKFLNKLN